MSSDKSTDSKKHLWRIHVKNLETIIGVGIHEHEKEKQRVIVNTVVEGEYPAKPSSIKDCFNYDYIHNLVVNIWPKHQHKPLLEDCAVELLEYIFRCDDRVTTASVRICKPDIFPAAESVGVETTWTRKDFENFIVI